MNKEKVINEIVEDFECEVFDGYYSASWVDGCRRGALRALEYQEDRIDELESLLRIFIRACDVGDTDPRIDYVEAQIDKTDIDDVRKLVGEES